MKKLCSVSTEGVIATNEDAWLERRCFGASGYLNYANATSNLCGKQVPTRTRGLFGQRKRPLHLELHKTEPILVAVETRSDPRCLKRGRVL